MAFSNVGINQIGIAKKGTFETSLANEMVLGLRPPGSLMFTAHNEKRDYRNRVLRNWVNAEAKFTTYQPQLLWLKNILTIYMVDGGADVEILAVPQSSGADGGCFQFNTAEAMGIDFEYILGHDARELAMTMNLALPYSDMKDLIDASDSNTPKTWTKSSYGIDFTLLRQPRFNTLTVGGSNLFGAQEIQSYRLTLSSEGRPDFYNRPQNSYINARLEVIGMDARISKLVSLMGTSSSSAVILQEDTGASTFEKFTFNAGVLTPVEEFTISDEDRVAKVILEGKFPKANMSFSFTAPDGGGTSADGTEGGSVTISL